MYANCLVIALINKIKHPSNKLYFIKSKYNSGGHCHVMWANKYDQNYHFTSKNQLKGIKILLFKGHIEELRPKTIQSLHGVRFL